MLSDEYQTILAETGLTPAKNSLAPLLGNDEFAAGHDRGGQQRQAHPGRARLGRASRALAILEDLFVAIASGGDVAELAAEADDEIDEQLNS